MQLSNTLLTLTFIMTILLFITPLILLLSWRKIIKHMIKSFGKVLLTDEYQENIFELVPGLRHMGVQNMLENSLRATTGNVIHRPLISSYKKWPHLDPITFIPAQTTPFPIDKEEPVDLSVTIGPQAKKPLQLDIPLLLSGMGFGVGISEQARLALVEAAKKMNTAINSGEGGILPDELQTAGKFILQFAKTPWGKEKETIKRADMIEIKLGQGAMFGMGKIIPPDELAGKAREIMNLKENEDAIIHENFFDMQTLEDLKKLVDELKQMTDGVPVGAKIGAGGKIEQDIDNLLEMGVDFITVDGGQAGMKEAPPILCDDFGIPLLHGLVRTVNHLEKRNMRDKVSVIASGGLLVPGHFLKALALGADAVYIGTALLFAVSHVQSLHALPFEPPTQVVWYNGKYKDKFDTAKGADSAEKFLQASVEEMRLGLRAMGKRSLQELSKQDLVCYEEHTAKMAGIPYSFKPWQQQQQDDKPKEKQTEQTLFTKFKFK